MDNVHLNDQSVMNGDFDIGVPSTSKSILVSCMFVYDARVLVYKQDYFACSMCRDNTLCSKGPSGIGIHQSIDINYSTVYMYWPTGG